MITIVMRVLRLENISVLEINSIMNERIREFAIDAGITTNLDTAYFVKDMNKWVDYYSENFAQLIIQECINEVSRYHSTTIDDAFIEEQMEAEHYEQWDYIKGNNTGYNYAVTKITEGLKKHFGVAE